MRIYPGLSVRYFILFLMYAEIIFLYYFNDLTGAVMTGLTFCVTTLIASIVATHLSEVWYGVGLVVGSFAGWSIAYHRIRWVEKNLDTHIFCKGTLLKKNSEKCPSSKVFDRYEKRKK